MAKAKDKLSAEMRMSENGGPYVSMFNLSDILPEDMVHTVIDAVTKKTKIPQEITDRINAAVSAYMKAKEAEQIQPSEKNQNSAAPKLSGIGPLANIKSSYEPRQITLTPAQLMDYQVIQLVQSYWSLHQPCMLVGSYNAGYTVFTHGITYELIHDAVYNQDYDFIWFTDGTSATKLK